MLGGHAKGLGPGASLPPAISKPLGQARNGNQGRKRGLAATSSFLQTTEDCVRQRSGLQVTETKLKLAYV